MSDERPIIIIKKIKKVAAHGHHGGAWKIAYADFVTAMMAFFLLMWLINATSEEQRRGIANYFDPTALTSTAGGNDGVMGGDSAQADDGGFDAVSSSNALQRGQMTNKSEATKEQGTERGGNDDRAKTSQDDPGLAAKKKAEAKERAAFKEIKERLEEAIQDNPQLKKLMDNLAIDETEEGLRIQMLDNEDRPMFPSGSADMLPEAKQLLKQVSFAITTVPNRISISGHTDAQPFTAASGYSNWELSSDRANACRRKLVAFGIAEKRIKSIVGKESTDPLIKEDPFSARNRRISIILVRGDYTEPRITTTEIVNEEESHKQEISMAEDKHSSHT